LLRVIYALYVNPRNVIKHGEKELVASAERCVNIASANQQCCGDNFNCYNNMNCHHNNYSCNRNK